MRSDECATWVGAFPERATEHAMNVCRAVCNCATTKPTKRSLAQSLRSLSMPTPCRANPRARHRDPIGRWAQLHTPPRRANPNVATSQEQTNQLSEGPHPTAACLLRFASFTSQNTSRPPIRACRIQQPQSCHQRPDRQSRCAPS